MVTEDLVSIIIPNFNGLRFLPFCLNSLKNQTYPSIEVIVVDNGSTDNSVKYIKETCPQVKIIVLDKNYGFAVAVNKGIKASKGEYIALLNNDAIADKDWVLESLKPFDENSQIGITTSLMKSPKKRKSLIDGAGDLVFTYGHAFKRGFLEEDRGQYNKSEFVFGGCGGASLYRKQLFLDIGYFDEDFFAYFEDVDLSFRAQLAGWKCFYSHKSLIYHYHHGTSRRNPNRLVYLSSRNISYLIIKNMPVKLLLKYWHQYFLNTFKLLQNISRDMSFAPYIIKGKLDFLFNLKKIIRKRNDILLKRKINDETLINLLCHGPEKEEKINELTNFISLLILFIYLAYHVNLIYLIVSLMLFKLINMARKNLFKVIRRKYYFYGREKIGKMDRISDFAIGNSLLLIILFYIFSFPVMIYVILSFVLLREAIRIMCRWSYSR